MPAVKICKPQPTTGPVGPQMKRLPLADHEKTSDSLESGKQLTFGEWVTIFDWHEAQLKKHVTWEKKQTVYHFCALGWKVSNPNFGR